MNEDRVRHGLVTKFGLSASDVLQVQTLTEAVFHTDGVGLKLNLPRQLQLAPFSESVPGKISDFCYYDDACLVGFAPLDGDSNELEVTVAVLPSHRRQGIFSLLIGAAQKEARRRGARRLLLVNYRASVSGSAAVQALGLPYVHSEYCMEAKLSAAPSPEPGEFRLIQIDESNVAELAHLLVLSFVGESKSVTHLLKEIRTAGVRYFLAEQSGEWIGQIGVMTQIDGQSVYLRAVGVIPECRGRGYGRQLLANTLRLMLSEGYTRFSLDVSTDNPQALTVYEACGFRMTEAYDYYELPLTDSKSWIMQHLFCKLLEHPRIFMRSQMSDRLCRSASHR